MGYSGIGGQAVMEGVMMKHKDAYAVAVRKPDHKIIVEKRMYHGICRNRKLRNVVFIRGVISFVESMVLGLSTLTYSASFFEEDQEKPKNEKKEKAEMGFTIILSLLLALVIFMAAPFYASLFFHRYILSETVIILIEGALRLLMFFAYILLISQMKDIRRVFMYHGAEHKCINCIEHGMDLTVENVKISSREHKRCGTSFLFIVIVVTIIATMFIRVDSRILRMVLRIAIVPLVAGISYEFIRIAGRNDNPIVNILSKPGMLLQKFTTREPDEEMIEVGIASIEAIYDWRSYVESVREKEMT